MEFTNWKKIDRKLKALPGKVAKKILRQELRKTAKEMLKETANQVPVDTGRLRDGLAVRAGKRKKDTIRVNCVIEDVPYGWAVHQGTETRAPDPYMQRAFDAVGPQEKERLIKDIGKRIVQEAKK